MSGIDTLIQPINSGLAVTPSDTVNQTGFPRGLYIGTAGTVTLVSAAGTIDVYTGLATGIWHPIRFTRVNATGTTATNILAGY